MAVQKASEILATHIVQELTEKAQNSTSARQVALLARTTWLFDLGLRLLRIDPHLAEITWQEILELDPNHRKALANIKRLKWARQKSEE
jgi:hypothetical protein